MLSEPMQKHHEDCEAFHWFKTPDCPPVQRREERIKALEAERDTLKEQLQKEFDSGLKAATILNRRAKSAEAEVKRLTKDKSLAYIRGYKAGADSVKSEALKLSEVALEQTTKGLEIYKSRLGEAQGVLEEAPFPDVAQFGQFCSCYHLWVKRLESALAGVKEDKKK